MVVVLRVWFLVVVLIVLDEDNKLMHYIEHPESFVSNTINGGLYCFSPDVFAIPAADFRVEVDINLGNFYVYAC